MHVVLTTVLLLVACSASAPQGAGPAPSVCAPACRSVGVCIQSEKWGKPVKFDQAGCEKQCALELAGSGFLAKDVANLVFDDVARDDGSGGDIACELGEEQFSGGTNARLAEPGYIERCVNTQQRICPMVERSSQQVACFLNEYRYNNAVRAKTGSCATTYDECMAFQNCYNAAQAADIPKCLPWFGPSGADCQ
jgi:hypothetical protein